VTGLELSDHHARRFTAAAASALAIEVAAKQEAGPRGRQFIPVSLTLKGLVALWREGLLIQAGRGRLDPQS